MSNLTETKTSKKVLGKYASDFDVLFQNIGSVILMIAIFTILAVVWSTNQIIKDFQTEKELNDIRGIDQKELFYRQLNQLRTNVMEAKLLADTDNLIELPQSPEGRKARDTILYFKISDLLLDIEELNNAFFKLSIEHEKLSDEE